jgi:hypothetical protein
MIYQYEGTIDHAVIFYQLQNLLQIRRHAAKEFHGLLVDDMAPQVLATIVNTILGALAPSRGDQGFPNLERLMANAMIKARGKQERRPMEIPSFVRYWSMRIRLQG